MNFFNSYPYTDFHELNLDWVLKCLKELDKEWDEFQVLNTITIQGVWNISKNYPKYSIVEDNGTGYLSIKPVPAGILISNIDYWLPVGTYSTAIADLNTRLTAAEGNITTMQGTIAGHTTAINNLSAKLDINNMLKGQIVYIGDSYLAGWTPDGDVTSWGQRLKNIMNKPNDKIFAVGGAGFCNTVGGENFRTLVDTAAADPDVDNDKVTLVLFGGGWNDKGYSTADLVTAMQDASNKVRNNFPNAVALFAYMAWDRNSGNFTTYNKLYLPARYANAIKQTNIGWIENIYKCLQAPENYFSSDGTHPNNEGQKAIANAIYSALIGSYSPGTMENKAITGESNIFVSSDENNYCILFYLQKRFPVTLSDIRGDGSSKVAELDLSEFGIKPGSDYFIGNLRGFIEGFTTVDPLNNSYHDVTYECRLKSNGKLEFYYWAINATNNSYLNFNTASNVYIYPGTLIIPKVYC